MSIPHGGGYPPGPPPGVPGPPGAGWNNPGLPPHGGPPPPGGPLPPGGPPGGWPPHGYPQGPPPPPGGGNRTGVIIGVIAVVLAIVGVVVGVVLLTQGDDDKDKTAGPTNGVSSKLSGTKVPPTDDPTTPSTRPNTTAPTTPSSRPPNTTGGRGTVLSNLKANDCIDTIAATTIVVDPIYPVPCSGATSHWKIIDVFVSADAADCEALPPNKGYVGHLKEFNTGGRVACLGFTRNTTLQDLKNLAGSAVANLSQADFDQLVQSYRDKGVVIE